MEERRIAKIYVEQAVYHIDKPFDYLVPNEMGELCRGVRVLVPFGRSNKKVQGLVQSVSTASPELIGKQLKPVFSIIDKTPVIDDELFSIIEFLVKNTFCTYYDAVKCVLPISENVSVVESYRICSGVTLESIEKLPDSQRRLAAFLLSSANENGKSKTAREIADFSASEKPSVRGQLVKLLLDNGIIEKVESTKARVAKRTVKMVRLADGFEPDNVKLSIKQKEVVNMLLSVETAMIKELAYLCGVTEGVIKGLQKKYIVVFYERELEPVYSEQEASYEDLSGVLLSEAQNQVYEDILAFASDEKPHAALLHGVTGSGKTQVYIKLIEAMLKLKKTAMLLVPEIALTPQLLLKFDSLFGDIIAVIHSNLSVRERQEADERIRAGRVSIVIGTRSAVFAPLKNIGIIIMDEEGESSYKSDSPPRYHARDIAKLRCVFNKSLLLLCSATPAVDSYYNASIGKYKLFTLEERYANANLPSVYIIDMLEEQRNKNTSSLSELLTLQLSQNLAKHEQSILLINRRGYNTYATCMSCGEVIKCRNCDVALTYHKANELMMCHYCGHTEKLVTSCPSPSCNGSYIKLTGLGTQKLEDELSSLFPKARLLRMDTDSTYSKFSYEKNFADFKSGKYDILLGTQMIAKGLDFPNVTLVGVLNADNGLYSADFKAGERIFSLITQVVGRSGRGEKSGRAYIQTNLPDNPIINFAANQDYKAFYEDEIFTRKEMRLPPFCDIVTLGFSGENENAVETAAFKANEILRANAVSVVGGNVAMRVMGVSKATVQRISNKYRYRILIKCKLNNAMKSVISQTLKTCGGDKLFAKVTCFADVNGDTL